MSWLFVCPVFDPVTEITYDEARDAIAYARSKGVTVKVLAKEDAVREKVEEILKEDKDISIAHYDHGSHDKIWGNDDRPVIDLENVNLLDWRHCYNNNCSSAKTLGVEAYERGALYWGYDDIFYFTTDAKEEFKEAVNYGFKRRVDGFSWKDCLEQTRKRMTEIISALVKMGKALAASCLRHDRDHLMCWGVEEPSPPTCPVSRFIVTLFGWSTLHKLRQLRAKLVRTSSNRGFRGVDRPSGDPA